MRKTYYVCLPNIQTQTRGEGDVYWIHPTSNFRQELKATNIIDARKEAKIKFEELRKKTLEEETKFDVRDNGFKYFMTNMPQKYLIVTEEIREIPI